MTTPHKVQFSAAIVMLALVIVFVILNRDTTEVNFLFGEFTVSRAWLVLGFSGSGFIVGWLAHSLLAHLNRARKSRSPDSK